MFGSAKKDKEAKSGSRDKSVDTRTAENPDKEEEKSSKKKEKKEKTKLKLINKHKSDKSANSEDKSSSAKNNHDENLHESNENCQIFGVALELAVERHKSHDGIPLPLIVRMCVDYIEEEGLMQEGIYRSSGVKSKINKLKSLFNCPSGRTSINLKVHSNPVITNHLGEGKHFVIISGIRFIRKDLL